MAWRGYKINSFAVAFALSWFYSLFFLNKLVLAVVGFNFYGGACGRFLAVQCLCSVLLR